MEAIMEGNNGQNNGGNVNNFENIWNFIVVKQKIQ
jgi:hypothetical protein